MDEQVTVMRDSTLLLRALLREDWDAVERLAEELRQLGEGPHLAIYGFAFVVAVRRHFGPRRTRADVIRFVAAIRNGLVDGRQIPISGAEALVYAALDIDAPGVVETINSMDAVAMADIESRILIKLVADDHLTDEQIDTLLREAEQLASRVEAEG